MATLQLVAGLLLLFFGGEFLVRGASQLALTARLSPLFVGLTIVAFGTSMPEMVVSIAAALKGEANIALGNVIGSNIFNVLFILGISSLVSPLVVKHQIIRWDVPIMIVVSGLCWLLCYDGYLTGVEGTGLLVGLIGYTVWSYLLGAKELRSTDSLPETETASQSKPSTSESSSKTVTATGKIPSWLWQVALIVCGLGLLICGCELFVDGAIIIATQMGIPSTVVGLTIVAAGTSLPELATSVIASYRNEREIAIGNVVGSNLFNMMGVLGATAAASVSGMTIDPTLLRYDLPFMIVVACLCFPIFLTGKIISRLEGGFLLSLYIVYTLFLISTIS